MTTYYADTAGSNTSPYDTWAKAATDLQTVLDLASAGDTIYLRGTFTLSAPLDIDTNSGDTTSGLIKMIGCAASGDVDGTRAVLDGNSAAATCLAIASETYWLFENIELTGATGDGCNVGTESSHLTFVNCYSHDNGSHGWDMYYNLGWNTFIRCEASDNGGSGFYRPYKGTRYYFCKAIGNTDSGIIYSYYAGENTVIFGCVVHGNGTGITAAGGTGSAHIINCVIDGNTGDGIDSNSATNADLIVIGCRITNNGGYGIDVDADASCFHGWNFFNNNTSGNVNASAITQAIPYGSDTDTNEATGTEGYVDRASDNFNLTDAATLRSFGIELS